jgi:hypothetical protein
VYVSVGDLVENHLKNMHPFAIEFLYVCAIGHTAQFAVISYLHFAGIWIKHYEHWQLWAQAVLLWWGITGLVMVVYECARRRDKSLLPINYKLTYLCRRGKNKTQ